MQRCKKKGGRCYPAACSSFSLYLLLPSQFLHDSCLHVSHKSLYCLRFSILLFVFRISIAILFALSAVIPFSLSPGASPPGGCQKSIKNRPTTTISNQTTATTSFIIFFILILQTDYDIFLGRGGFPPRNLSDTLYNHFDYGYESSNFKGKLCKCFYHFYQLAYFLVHLYSSFLLLMILLYHW